MKGIDIYRVKRNWILVTCSGTIGRTSLVRNYWHDWTATNHLLRIVPQENDINPGYLTAFLLSIYGRVQFQRLIYGGVVDEIGEAGELFNDILILKPNSDLQNEIGRLVYQAYDEKDRANIIENEAVSLLESKLTDSRFEFDNKT
jgi:type I restriction enzyme S subunit